jgi:aldehyde dehydrogenase (NAD+)
MAHEQEFYIGGAWVAPRAPRRLYEVVNPATEEAFTQSALGGPGDVDFAVGGARRALPAWSRSTRAERLDLLRAILAEYDRRSADIAAVLSAEMGAPITMALESQVYCGHAHLAQMIADLETFAFETLRPNGTLIARIPIGVVGLITPWNWPLNQIASKVAPALAAGCTMVLKPSELSPLNAIIWAEVMHAAGTPAGVFNMVQGDGPTVGEAISAHPGIDMVSFTGSTRAGIQVARAAAATVKRVSQELGGKSPNILLDDADFPRAVKLGVNAVMDNSGQSCNAPTRMFVPAARHDEACALARAAADAWVPGDPSDPRTQIGPVVSAAQFAKIQHLIEAGIAEGARLVTGGPGRPGHLNRGFFVRPTVFGDVRNHMTIAREEIFGPVLSILPYASEEEAIAQANDTPYGLAGYVQSANIERARAVAARLHVGRVQINHPAWDTAAPFGGTKQSGNGREYGTWGLEEFLEVKAVVGHGPA